MRILITGMAAGIGQALAQHWAGPGIELVGVDRDAGDVVLEACRAKGAQATMMHGDLASRGDVDALSRRLAEVPPFDIVVHNAGISCVGPFEKTDAQAQHAVWAVNLEAPLVLTGALLRAKRVASSGSIVFLSSLSHQVGYPAASVYAATKDGIASYARSLDVALHRQKIRVLRVFPGPVRTDHAARYSPPDSDASKRMLPNVVARKIATAVAKRKRTLVPGAGPKVFALLGRWMPRVTERALKKALYDPLVVDGLEDA